MRADLLMKLYADETKMKPEFTGRFFAKIYKDELLEQYILTKTSQATEYEILATWGLRYIGNNGYFNAGTFGSTQEIPYDAVEFNSHSTDPSDHRYSTQVTATGSSGAAHPSEWNWANYANIDDIGGPYFWGGGQNANDNEYDAFGLSAANLTDQNSQNSGPCETLADLGEGDAEQFWLGIAGTKDFFIDACTAYSWTGKGNNSDHAR